MSKDMIVSTSPHETKVALQEGGRVVEIYVEREGKAGLAGSIYKGRVTRVLPGMQSAFVDIGLERDAFLYVSDFYESLEELGDIEQVLPPVRAVEEPPVEEAPAQEEEAQPAAEAGAESESETSVAEENEGEEADDQLAMLGPQGAEPSGEGQNRPGEEGRPPRERRGQPGLSNEEPPLHLPEVRPQGRSRSRRPPRRRGGRGRPRPGRDDRPRGRDDRRAGRDDRRFGRGRGDRFRGRRSGMRETRTGPPQSYEPYEPVILPGESLSKYRGATPLEAREPEAGATQPELEATVPTPESVAAETPALVEPAVPEPAPEAAATEQETAAETLPAAAEPTPSEASSADAGGFEAAPAEEGSPAETLPESLPVTEAEGAEPAEPAPARESEAAEASTPQPGAPAFQAAERAGEETPPRAEGSSPEGNGESITLAELKKVRQYEGEVGLPPSVGERTEGGVVWSRTPRPRMGRGDRSGPGGRQRGRRGRGGRRRPGRRPPPRRRTHARPSRGQPAIAELLKSGQEIIVQIAKEQMGKKGARITSHITLPGRFLVYMPTIDHVGISRKIGSLEERRRLRRLLLELKGRFSGGFVVRTAAAGSSEEELREDVDYLVKLWQNIRQQAEEGSAPLLLHRDANLVERLLRDHLTREYNSIWIDNEEDYTGVVEFISRFQPTLAGRAKLFTRATPIFEEMGVQQEIDQALRPKVWLKSGGYIVINHTEALVAIDVNTGKFVGKGSTRLEDTIVKTNVEAVEEIVRQIRLRDLGGIIIIDFIDMEDPRNRHKVMRALEGALRDDRSPSKLLSFNEFGLVAITRKRSRLSLERMLCQPCPICTGTGMVKSMQTLCFEIQNEARKMADEIDAPELTIRAHPDVVTLLKGRESRLVQELEQQTSKNIILQMDNTLHYEQYNIY